MPKSLSAIYFKLVLTALFWGATWIAGRVAVQEASPFAIASWRFLLAAAILGALLVSREGWPKWSGRDWLLLAALGLTGVFFYNIFFLYGLRRVEAGRGALVTASIPALIALVDWLCFRLPMSAKRASGVALALFGCLLVVTRGHPTQLLNGDIGGGELLLVGAAFSWVSYTLISRYCARRFSALAMTFGACFTGWLMLTVAGLGDGSLFAFGAMSWRGWTSIGFLALFGTVIAFTWYCEAISRVGTTKTASFINLVPLFAVLLGALILGERLDAPVLAGGAIVIAGVLLTSRAAEKNSAFATPNALQPGD